MAALAIPHPLSNVEGKSFVLDQMETSYLYAEHVAHLAQGNLVSNCATYYLHWDEARQCGACPLRIGEPRVT